MSNYGVFKKVYGDKVRLLVTDTDSLFYEIKTQDVYEDLLEKHSRYKNIFDTSNFKNQIQIILRNIRKKMEK